MFNDALEQLLAKALAEVKAQLGEFQGDVGVQPLTGDAVEHVAVSGGSDARPGFVRNVFAK